MTRTNRRVGREGDVLYWPWSMSGDLYAAGQVFLANGDGDSYLAVVAATELQRSYEDDEGDA